MSADEEIDQQAFGLTACRFSSSARVNSKALRRLAPHGLIKVKIHFHACCGEELINELLSDFRMCDKFRINRPAHCQCTLGRYAPEQSCHLCNDRATGP